MARGGVGAAAETVVARLRARLRRPAAAAHAADSRRGLGAAAAPKHGWQVAEAAGDAPPRDPTRPRPRRVGRRRRACRSASVRAG